MNQNLLLYEDSALFVGIVKTQTDKNIKTFFKNEFKSDKGLFKKYKKGLITNASSDAKIQEKEKDLLIGFYEPEGYILFGDADLAVISQVDDFMFGGHLFHPTHPFKTNHEDAKFFYDYQIITGYTPSFSLNNDGTLSEKWNSVFNSANKKFPFIAITRIKINSSMTVGVGRKVNILIAYLVKELFYKKNLKEKKCDFFLIESFCSYEFTLISLSNSLKTLTELVLSLREFSLNSLLNLSCLNSNNNANILEVIDEIKQKSLLSFWIKYPKIYQSNMRISKDQIISEIKNLSILDSHLITKTQTTFGYHIDYYENRNEFISILDINEVEFTVNFNIKPGHINSFRTQMEKYKEFNERFNEIAIISGDSIYNSKFKSDEDLPIPKFDYFYPEINSYTNFIFEPNFNVLSNLNKIRTSFKIKMTTDGIQGISLHDFEKISNNHLRVTEKLKDLLFRKDHLENIHTWLKKIGVSKVLQTRIQKMYGNFNDNIQDPVLHIYFIDLLLYLKWIYYILHDYANSEFGKYSLNDIHTTLNELINNFEHAFKNKHHQTYLEQNATDSNLEYAGGLHQIICGYEAFFRVVQSGMNFDIEKNAIAYVSGEPNVESDAYAIRLNYYHLYNVQHFMVILLKEASNFYFPSNNKIPIAKNLDLNKKGRESLEYLKFNQNSYWKIKKIREELEIRINFKYANKSELVIFLYDNINNTLFQYILSDFINFYYTTNSVFDLFVYWHLSLFLQNPTHYTMKRGIVDKSIWHTLLRLNIIALIGERICDCKRSDEVISNYLSTLNINESSHLIEVNNTVHEFCKFLFDCKEFFNWAELMKMETTKLFINIDNPVIKKAANIVRSYIKGKIDVNDIYNKLIIESYKGLKEKIDFYQNSFNSNLINNLYTEYEDKDYSAFVLAITNSVLLKLKEFNSDKIQILKRNEVGSPDNSMIFDENIKLYNDPFGGVFIRGHANRIGFFKFRREVLNTMMDFALKIKIELYKTRIDILKTKKEPQGGDLF